MGRLARRSRRPAISPDGRYLLTLTNEQVQVWERPPAAAQPVAQRSQGDLPFDSAWFSPGGQWVVLELAGKVYELWPAPGQPAADGAATQYAQAIFSGDGRRLLTVDFDGDRASSGRPMAGAGALGAAGWPGHPAGLGQLQPRRRAFC